MANRFYLTPSVVSTLQCPEEGEAWVADTRDRGFGVRLWRANNGEARMAYCVRKQAPTGKFIRRTYDPSLGYWDFSGIERYFWRRDRVEPQLPPAEFEKHLPFARKWARDVLERNRKGLPEYRQEIEDQRNFQRKRCERYTLEQVASAIFENLRATGATADYVLHLEKLFFAHIGSENRSSYMSTVDVERVWNEVISLRNQAGNFRSLRMIVRRMFSDFHEVAGTRNRYERVIYDFEPGSFDKDGVAKFLENRSASNVIGMIDSLLDSEDSYSQTRCLYLYLRSRKAPLVACMEARFSDFYLLEPDLNSYQFGPPRAVNWKYADRQFAYEAFGEDVLDVIRDIRDRLSNSELPVQFLFPSNAGRSVQHIRTVDLVWRRWLDAHSIPYSTPARFRAALLDHRRREWWAW